MLLFVGMTSAFTAISVFNESIHAVNQQRRSLDLKRHTLESLGFSVSAFEKKYYMKLVEIPSTFQEYKIQASYLTVDGNKNRDTVVMAHGLNGSRYTGYFVAKMLLENGYNVLTFDQRESGESPARYMTCGYFESRDVKDCVTYIRKQISPRKKVGLWGSSMGGATIGIYLGTTHGQENVNFAMMDCPVSNMRDIVAFLIRDDLTLLPMDYRLAMGDLATRIKLGFSYEDANVCEKIKDTKVPVLIMHSAKDTVTPYYMGVDIFCAIKSRNKQIWTVYDSRHTKLYLDHPKEYERKIMTFIKERGT